MKKNKLLTILLIIIVVLTLLGVIAFVMITQLNKQGGANEPSIDDIVVATVEVPEMTTNLADNKFVRISFKIQTSSEDAAAELTKRDFQTKNLIIKELSEMTEEDLQGKTGQIGLEKTLKTQINELMQEGEVEQVYITSYIIQ